MRMTVLRRGFCLMGLRQSNEQLMKLRLIFYVLCLALTSCTGTPINAVPVTGFDSDRYLGTWYEIARLDHPFERGLSNVSATYTKRADGTINVNNRGYNTAKESFKEATGKAKFASDASVGQLKVSFFGPFYGDYIIFDLDKENYRHAYISGGSDNYLWLLSRTPEVTESLRQDFIAKSMALGYDTNALIWVSQTRVDK